MCEQKKHYLFFKFLLCQCCLLLFCSACNVLTCCLSSLARPVGVWSHLLQHLSLTCAHAVSHPLPEICQLARSAAATGLYSRLALHMLLTGCRDRTRRQPEKHRQDEETVPHMLRTCLKVRLVSRDRLEQPDWGLLCMCSKMSRM